jgi:hypothetical protein
MQYLLHSVLRGVQQCAVAPGARRYAGPTVVQVQGRYDQGDMRERLRKISDLPPHVRIVLLGEQADIVAKRQQALEQGPAHAVAEPFITSPEEFLKILQADVEKWAKVVKAAGVSLN